MVLRGQAARIARQKTKPSTYGMRSMHGCGHGSTGLLTAGGRKPEQAKVRGFSTREDRTVCRDEFEPSVPLEISFHFFAMDLPHSDACLVQALLRPNEGSRRFKSAPLQQGSPSFSAPN